MDPLYYEKKLYPLQDKVLQNLRDKAAPFYLTGGTCLSRVYFHHRYSDDLDFFVNDIEDFPLQLDRVWSKLRQIPGCHLEVILRESRFGRVLFQRDGVSLKMEWINDVPSRVGTSQWHENFGWVDNLSNVLANKITAALGRQEPKDISDLWVLCKKGGFSLADAIEGASSKAAGIFPGDLARVLLEVPDDYFERILWSAPPLKADFYQDLKQLGEDLLLYA